MKPGVDPALVSKRLDEVMADYIAKGPSVDEVERAVMSEVSGRIRGLEQVGGFGGKAVTLAEGQTFAGDSDFYKKTLASYASITPAAIRAAMQQWLTRPPLTIILSPGERAQYAEAKGVAPPKPGTDKTAGAVKGNRPLPPVGQLAALDFPDIVHAKLSNGIAVDFVQRSSVPVTQVAMAFDAGSATDSPQARGLAAMTMDLLDEGTSKLTLAASRRDRGAAGRGRQHQQRRGPVVRDPQRAVAEPRAVARPDERRGQGRGVPPRRHRPHPGPDPDQHRADAEGPDAGRAAAAAVGAVRRQPSLRRTARGRSGGDRRSSAAPT